MTPTEQDNELRDKINHRFDSVCAEGHQQSCGEYQTAVDDVMQLITADRKRVALEARIDAAEHVLNTMVHEAGGYCDEIGPDAIPNYIAELKQELEKL